MIYTGPLIDAHHHLWDLSMGKHPWLVRSPGQEMVFGDPTPLYRDYLPADLEADGCNQKSGGFGSYRGWLGPQRPDR